MTFGRYNWLPAGYSNIRTAWLWLAVFIVVSGGSVKTHAYGAHAHGVEAEQTVSDQQTAMPFPLQEMVASVGFVALLSMLTLILMWRTGRRSPRTADDHEALLRELADLRAEVHRLRGEPDPP